MGKDKDTKRPAGKYDLGRTKHPQSVKPHKGSYQRPKGK